MLNKITGCESRTVPPLYGVWKKIVGENRSLGKPGKADLFRVRNASPESEDLRIGALLTPAVIWGCVVAEKRLRCYSSGTAAYCIFRRKKV